MNDVLNKIRKLFNKLIGFFPSQLPTGLTEFNSWSESVIDTYDLSHLADIDSMKATLALTIIHLDQAQAHMSKRYMANRLIKAASNQISSFVFQDIKYKKDDEAKQRQAAELAASKPAEVTAQPVATSDGQKQ
jgi:hypothetical protein